MFLNDFNSPAREPKFKTKIILSVIGLIGSLLFGMPVLPYVFGGCIIVFILHELITK
jgi:hypothetical protein